MVYKMINVPVEANYLQKPTFLVLILVLGLFPCYIHGFSFEFYALSCPGVEFVVRDAVRSAASTDPTVPGKLLRLLFHDCFVNGCDASVLVEGDGTEKADPANKSLGGFEVIETAKRELELFCPGTVSCADILALAARDAVVMAGGPDIQMPTGRKDGMVSMISNVRPNIVDTSFTVDDMAKIFSSKGLSLTDLVILSGAHTIGSAHCNAFSDRFQVSSKGNLTSVDSSLDKDYAEKLAKKCASSTSETVNFDPKTAFSFDNQYYKNLMEKKGLLQTDSVLFNDQRTKNLIEQFASDLNSFYGGWSESFLKLSSIGVKTDGEGEVRQICSRING
ncbi:peroxidase 18-like [Chenopodium quinoa]|uniref:peroxidase 18-like n=1 Tax=Chenopodium quinoa TaxID=63459 RepID=UPI000B78B1DB|nr:peroxidase 18-like [Chenopodium quinoa]